MKTILLLPFFLALAVHAQPYSVDWYKVAGGGGVSTGGVFSASGTIGQPDAGAALSGGNYSVTGGFWSLISVVQTPGAPTLSISHTGSSVTVFWPDVSGWSLEQNTTLATPASWSASGGVSLVNGTNSLTLPSSTGNRFFRLAHP